MQLTALFHLASLQVDPMYAYAFMRVFDTFMRGYEILSPIDLERRRGAAPGHAAVPGSLSGSRRRGAATGDQRAPGAVRGGDGRGRGEAMGGGVP